MRKTLSKLGSAVLVVMAAACGRDYFMPLPEEPEVNHPPYFRPATRIALLSGEEATEELVALDPDGDELTLSAEGLPAFATFTASGGSGVLHVVAPADTTFEGFVEITAHDGKLGARMFWPVSVHKSSDMILEPTQQVSALFGSPVAAGDVNGDGFGDLAVGVPGSGEVVLFYGSPRGVSADRYALLFALDLDAGAGFGTRVEALGDVNGDAYADLAVSAPSADVGNFQRAGRVYLYYGAAGGPDLTTPTVLTMAAPVSDVGFGSPFKVGDLDGDGYADLAVGVNRFATDGIYHAGKAYVYWGGADGVATGSAVEVRLSPARDEANYAAVIAAGDFNNDGLRDLVVGAPTDSGVSFWSGSVYLYLGNGGRTFTSAPLRYEPNGTDLYRRQFGGWLLDPGDVNGDGFEDLVVGANSAYSPGGRAYLQLGHAGGLATPASIEDPYMSPSGRFGSPICALGDIDLDGRADFAIGALDAGTDQPGAAGKLVIYSGEAANPIGKIASRLLAPNVEEGARFGSACAGNIDIDGDGRAELVAGAPGANAVGVEDSGALYVYYAFAGVTP